jgi:hypothetical protein
MPPFLATARLRRITLKARVDDVRLGGGIVAATNAGDVDELARLLTRISRLTGDALNRP